MPGRTGPLLTRVSTVRFLYLGRVDRPKSACIDVRTKLDSEKRQRVFAAVQQHRISNGPTVRSSEYREAGWKTVDIEKPVPGRTVTVTCEKATLLVGVSYV